MLRSSVGRSSRWNSFLSPFSVPKALALVLVPVWIPYPENFLDPNFQYSFQPMKIDLRPCNMIPAFAFRGVRHQMAPHGLQERNCGIFGQN
jgi:hypothetical protein